jgi:phytanoyl-CoA hydroxylase
LNNIPLFVLENKKNKLFLQAKIIINMNYLSNLQVANYHKNGFLIVESFLSEDEILSLCQNATEIIERFNLSEVKIFTTDNQTQILDNYFLESAAKVSCFFEENAFNQQGLLEVSKQLAINKIGHAMHDLEPDCEKIAYSQKLLEVMHDIGVNQPLMVQSQYIFKQPKIGAKVNPHTDSTFIYSKPLTCVAAWIAMEDATVENGCLCVIPESHKIYPLQQQYIKNATGTGTEFIDTSNPRVEWDLDLLEPVEVKKGDLVLLHGEVVHASYANTSERSRHAFVLHLVDATAEWSEKNWLQRPKNMPFRKMNQIVKEITSK